MEIPQVVVERLPIYARALAQLEDEHRDLVSSQELGARLGITPAQIRKDLSYFGHFGKQGRGYNVVKLAAELRRILGLDRQWRIALVGVGRLGRAILGYSGFAPQGFRVTSAFDSDSKMIGQQLDKLQVKDISELEDTLSKSPVDIGIVAVPAAEAQSVIDRLISCGVRAILNYAPVASHVPHGVYIRHIDPVLVMQSMTFYLKAEE
jgi:redox-sensing transcriptional repressor